MLGRSNNRLIATQDWKNKARAAFNAKGRGSLRDCASRMSKSPAAITKMLNKKGDTATDMVEPISTYLGIDTPVKARSPMIQELSDIAEELEGEELGALVTMARLLKQK